MKIRKYILYSLFLVVLFLPLFQRCFHVVKEKPLDGAYVTNEKPELSAESWFDGSFQSHFEAYENDTLGLHHTAVRLRNSFCLNVFHKANAEAVVVGKKNFLFEQGYIDAYYGLDYIGLAEIEKKVCRIREFQDSLDKEGKKLIICLAPSKADYFPEYLPNFYKHIDFIPDSTNYRQFKRLFDEYGVRYIDYNQYFMSQKTKTKYPLYPQYGIHWSYYGSVYAMDSLIRYVEQLQHIRLNRMHITGISTRPTLYNFDYDLGKTMNLAGKNQLRSYQLYYPQWQWEEDTSLSKPNLLAIADSYYWGMYNAALQFKCFTGKFCYYNKTVYPESLSNYLSTDDIDMHETINESDIILVMCTTLSLCNFGWDFFEKY